MSFLEIREVSKYFGVVAAVESFSLDVDAGEFVSLLGPSGCGKTTLLRLIGGLEQPSRGEIFLEGSCINQVPPQKRGMAMVVQNYALFPNMTVAENVAYGLRVRRVPRHEVRERSESALRLVRLSGTERRFPNELSGGQQQRCALARALVIEPKVLLLDEALGALDQNLREEMRVELKQLQRSLGVTAIHVTHDQHEALGMSDKVVVVNGGHAEQIGAPTDVYEYPHTEFVADFVGDTNVFRGRVHDIDPDGTVHVRTKDDQKLTIAPDQAGSVWPGTDVKLAIRPEYMSISEGPHGSRNCIEGSVETVVYRGNTTKVVVRLPNQNPLTVYRSSWSVDTKEEQVRGRKVWVSWPPTAARVLRT